MNPNILIKVIIDLLKTEPFNTIFWAGFYATLFTNFIDMIMGLFGDKKKMI